VLRLVDFDLFLGLPHALAAVRSGGLTANRCTPRNASAGVVLFVDIGRRDGVRQSR